MGWINIGEKRGLPCVGHQLAICHLLILCSYELSRQHWATQYHLCGQSQCNGRFEIPYKHWFCSIEVHIKCLWESIQGPQSVPEKLSQISDLYYMFGTGVRFSAISTTKHISFFYIVVKIAVLEIAEKLILLPSMKICENLYGQPVQQILNMVT